MDTDGDIQAAIDRAFRDAPYGLTYTQTDEESHDTRLFMLRSNAFYDLQTYVMIGLTLPPTEERFKSDFPEDRLDSLKRVDMDIYGHLQSRFPRVFTHCHDFQLETMGKFTTLTASIVNFCDDASRYIGAPGLLKDQIAILIDPEVLPTSPAFIKAAKISKAILTTLAQCAHLREVDCADLVSRLDTFHTLSTTDKNNIDELYVKFFEHGVHGRPYTAILEPELAELREEAERLYREYRREKQQYKYNCIKAGTSVLSLLVPGFGLIAGGVLAGIYGKRAEDIRDKMAKIEAKRQRNTEDAIALRHCLNFVKNIGSQIRDVHEAVAKAVVSLQAMSTMFARIKADFLSIAGYMGGISRQVEQDDCFLRKLATSDLNATISKWAEVKILAIDFMTHASIELKILDSP